MPDVPKSRSPCFSFSKNTPPVSLEVGGGGCGLNGQGEEAEGLNVPYINFHLISIFLAVPLPLAFQESWFLVPKPFWACAPRTSLFPIGVILYTYAGLDLLLCAKPVTTFHLLSIFYHYGHCLSPVSSLLLYSSGVKIPLVSF